MGECGEPAKEVARSQEEEAVKAEGGVEWAI